MQVVVLDVGKCRDAAAAILEQNCIPGAGHFPAGLIQVCTADVTQGNMSSGCSD
jgi:hypothetical protein